MSQMTDQQTVKAAMAEFPETFGLRAYPGKVFKIVEAASFVSEGTVLLYTFIQEGDTWSAFTKGTPAELHRYVVRLDPPKVEVATPKKGGKPTVTICPIRVGEYYERKDCGRTVPEGAVKCKLHLEHDRRAAVRHEQYQAEREALRVRNAAITETMNGIAKRLTIFSGMRVVNNELILSPAVAQQILDTLNTMTEIGD